MLIFDVVDLSLLKREENDKNMFKQAAFKVVSMVTEIKYAGSTGSVEFDSDSDKKIEMKYRVKVTQLIFLLNLNLPLNIPRSRTPKNF